MSYLSPKQAAEKWGITQQRVTELCRLGAVRGAWRDGGRWRIPEDAKRPERSDERRPIRTGVNIGQPSDSNQPSHPPLPIGISSFSRMMSGYSRVDKTLLIKDVIDSGAQVNMFLRPRRFGKTLNMDMMRCFFEKSEADASELFRDCLIWKEGEPYLSEMGKYPVVWVSLKDVGGLDWDAAFWMVKATIQQEFDRHEELYTSERLSAFDRRFFDSVISGSLPDAMWGRALFELMRILHRHHGVPAILFVDEYDTPIQNAYLHGYYDEMLALMRPLVSLAVKDNPHLHRGFLSGVTRIAKESIFSGLNNLKVDSVLGGGYAPYFGFTFDETKALLRERGREDMFGKVLDWYDGYRIDGIELVNPWSVNNFIDGDFRAQGYWQQTGSSEVIRQIVQAADSEILDQINILIGGGQITVQIEDGIAFPQVEGNPSAVFSFLLMAGYLRVDERMNLDGGDMLCKVSIPNKEIRQAYAREAIGGQPTVKSQTAAESIRNALILGDSEMLEKNLGRYVCEVVSYHDAVGEAFYHGMVVGLCAAAEGRYRVTSNRESGRGRYDVQLFPKRAEDPGVVIEVKAAEGPVDLQQLADAAVTQILEKDYARDLLSHGVRDIVTVGLAFRGKDVAVATLTSRGLAS